MSTLTMDTPTIAQRDLSSLLIMACTLEALLPRDHPGQATLGQMVDILTGASTCVQVCGARALAETRSQA